MNLKSSELGIYVPILRQMFYIYYSYLRFEQAVRTAILRAKKLGLPTV